MTKNNEKRPLAFLYVGCGGTFWAAHPFLSQIWHKHKPAVTAFIDPDIIGPENADRQWCVEASKYDEAFKACKANRNITNYLGESYTETFQEVMGDIGAGSLSEKLVNHDTIGH